MRPAPAAFARHAPALLAAGAVLGAAMALSELAPRESPVAAATVGPAPEADGGLPDACARRIGCLKR
jgi:hypothetical protein